MLLRNRLRNKINSYRRQEVEFLVSVIFDCSQTFSVDFLEFLLKRRHLKNWKKSVNNFIRNTKFNLMIVKKMIDLQLISSQINDKLVYGRILLHLSFGLLNNCEKTFFCGLSLLIKFYKRIYGLT